MPALLERLCVVGRARAFDAPFVHEDAIGVCAPPPRVQRSLAVYNRLGGLEPSADFPELENGPLVGVTERRSAGHVDQAAKFTEQRGTHRRPTRCPVQSNVA